MTQSYRIHVELKPKAPVVFSYPDLLKRQEQLIGKAPSLPMELENEQDNFFKSLLERAAKYDINPDEEEVDSGEEENVTSRDIRGNDYDYEDPFIDDSEMMLDEQYEYVEPEIDGYFVFHGSLDGEAASNIKKKSKKEKTNATNNKGKETTTTTQKSSSSASTSSSSTSSSSSNNKGTNGSSSSTTRKNNNNDNDPIEISDTDDEQLNDKSSPSKLKKSSNINSDSIKLPPTLKRSSSSSTTSSTDNNNNNKNTNKSNKSSSSTSTSSSLLNNNTTNSQNNNNNNNKTNKSSLSVNNNSNESFNNDNDSSSSNAAAKKKKVITVEDLQPLDSTIEPLIEKLRQDRQREDFAIKSKFPTTLRPTVVEIGIRMFRLHNKVDENIINHLMYILPYNRFTLNKFVTTKSGPLVVSEWQQEIEEMTQRLKEVVDDMMPDQIQQYEQKVLEQQSSSQSDEVTNDVEQKFRFNETTKRLLYDILTKDMHRVLLKKEVNELTDKPEEEVLSETKARKTMYAKLLPCWPKGWMTTFDISRQYSIMKTSIKMKLKNAEEAASKSNGNNTPTNSAGFKRSNGSNLKRPAPSSSGNSPVSSRNTNNNNSNNNNTLPNNDKRKKLNSDSSSTTTTTTINNNEDSNENGLNNNAKEMIDKELNPSYQSPPPPPSQPSQRPTSMKIESLISGP